ncbi:phasin family protein [Palleronia caenipelagi]|nr:phasin family protein [Palleronia caenipelagi]
MTDQIAETVGTEPDGETIRLLHPLHQSSSAGLRATTSLGSAFWAIGREVLSETKDHVRNIVQAKSIRQVAELHAAYLQHRLEMSATYTKEMFDLAGLHASEIAAPIRQMTSREKTD